MFLTLNAYRKEALRSVPLLRSLQFLISMISAPPSRSLSVSVPHLRSILNLRSRPFLRSKPHLRSWLDLLSGMWPAYENCLWSTPERLPHLSRNCITEEFLPTLISPCLFNPFDIYFLPRSQFQNAPFCPVSASGPDFNHLDILPRWPYFTTLILVRNLWKNLLRLAAAIPTRPLPRSSIDTGSGTALTSPIDTLEIIKLLAVSGPVAIAKITIFPNPWSPKPFKLPLPASCTNTRSESVPTPLPSLPNQRSKPKLWVSPSLTSWCPEYSSISGMAFATPTKPNIRIAALNILDEFMIDSPSYD